MTAELLAGAEPFSASNGPNGVLVLHGFTGSPQSVRSLAEAFADAGYSVELPLLPGHGTTIDDMLDATFEQWAGAAEQSYEALSARCDKVVVAGLSMGGTLSCYLAERRQEIAGAVLVNPLVEQAAESFYQMIRGLLKEGIEVIPGSGPDIAQPNEIETSYDGTPVRALLSLMDGVGGVQSRLGELTCPVLLFSSRADHVVPPSSGDLVAAEAGGSVERVFLERSYHVATLDYDAAEIESRSCQFAAKVFAS